MKTSLCVLAFVFALALSYVSAAEPSCCLPPYFTASYEHFVSTTGSFQADIFYSEYYGLRMDAHLWDPKATSSRQQLFLLKSGHLFQYNVTSGLCVHYSCPSCYQPFCAGGSSAYRFVGNITIGSQNASKWAIKAGNSFYGEITAVASIPGQCIPINELVMSGLYQEADTLYANSFFYNVRTLRWLEGSYFTPPAACAKRRRHRRRGALQAVFRPSPQRSSPSTPNVIFC